MIMLRQTPTESPGDDSSDAMSHKSLQQPTPTIQLVEVAVPEAVAGEQRQVITINNEEYEEMSVHTDDEEWDWQDEDANEHDHQREHKHEKKHHQHHHHQQQQQHHHHHEHHQHHQHKNRNDLQQADSIEELLGSSIESLEGDDDDDRATPLAWQRTSAAMGQSHRAESILLKLEDSPMTRRRKMIEADELVSEDEEDDIDSEDGSMYEEYECESPASSAGDYDDITDEEDDDEDDEDDDAWSGEYVYEEIELPDHITPIQKNWLHSWFSSTHRRRMEQISEGEEEDCDSDSDSEGSISLKDGQNSKGNDFDKSWGSLDSHMRSWHSQRSHRSYSPHYQVMSPPPLLRDIKALLPAKSPIRTSIPKSRKSDQPPPQAEKLVRNKEAVEEQELNDSLRLGDRTAFLKAKRKAAALKKPRQKKKDKEKERDKGKKSTTKTTAARTREKRPRQAKALSDPLLPAATESTASALTPPPPPPPPPSTDIDITDKDNNHDDVNTASDSKSKSKRKSTTLKLESSTHEGSKSARTLEGAEVENSARSKSKSKRNAKSKTKTNGSSTDKDTEKSDRSISKSTRRLKVAIDESQPVDGDSASNRRRKLKDSDDTTNNLTSPTKTKKRSKTKQTTSLDAETDHLDGFAPNSELPVLLETSDRQDVNTTHSSRQDPIADKDGDVLNPDQQDTTNDDANRNSTDQDVESFQKPDSKRSKRGKSSLSRLQSLPNIYASTPEDLDNTSKADTIKSEKKRPKSPKPKKGDIKPLALQQLALNSPTPFDVVDSSQTSSQKSLNSTNLPTDDSGNHDTEEQTSMPTTSKSPRTKANAKASSGTTLDMDPTKRPSLEKILGKSSSAKLKDDENASIKSRSTSARSRSTRSSKSRRKSDDKSQSKHETSASPADDDSQPTSKSLSSTKRGGKRTSSLSINSLDPLDAQRRSDPNLAIPTSSDDDTTWDRPPLSPRKARSMVNLGQFMSKSPSSPLSPSPSTNLANSSWSKEVESESVENESETTFLQLDITNDGKADAKQLSTTQPVRPSLLSQTSWNEKMSRRVDTNVPLSSQNSKATDSTQRQVNQFEEHATPSSSNRKTGLFRFLISPLKRATSFSEKPKKNLKEQNPRPSMLLSPLRGSSRPSRAKEPDKKSHSLHQLSSVVTFIDGTPSQQPSDIGTSDSSIIPNSSSNASATSHDTARTVQVKNGTEDGDQVRLTVEESANSESVQRAPLLQLKDDSAGTLKTSMMSLSLDEENSLNNDFRTGAEANVDPEVPDELPTPENGEVKSDSFISVSGRLHVKPKSSSVSTSNWKSIFSDDHEVATRRTSR